MRRKIYGVPLALALLSAAGLLCALLGDGVFDWLSWVALTAPLAVAGRSLLRRS